MKTLNSRQTQDLIDYKNSLKERADEFFGWASINNNPKEEKYELELSKQLDKIADEIEKIIYSDEV